MHPNGIFLDSSTEKKDNSDSNMFRNEITHRAWGLKGGLKLVIKSLLDFKEGFRTVLKERPNNDRFCIILLIIAFLLEMFTNYQWNNLYMYYRLKLKFGMEEFSLLMTLAGMVGLSGQYIFVPLFVRVLKFHDATISLLGNIIFTMSCFL